MVNSSYVHTPLADDTNCDHGPRQRRCLSCIEAIRWLAETEGHGDADFEEVHIKGVRRSWSEYHLSFRRELNVLETIPGHRGTLTSSLNFSEDRFLVDFVEEAELPPNMLRGQSTPDTDAPPAATPESDAQGLPEPYISFEPGVALYQRRLADAPSVDLEVTTWFIVFQRSRIANEANGDMYVRNCRMNRFLTPLQKAEEWTLPKLG
jgi:hypothetical protein